ncbi:hypothetical protein Goshw_023636 [Gossypium schwendimanii]|uniref:Uncharacterized protein n=1 Tax=Gossypium schwendimanii TaxID=34291 RepID=A0A7J9MDW7_GOSSC|nr:hypothetical protein [Gossypium schwendimanii]
MIPQTGPKDEDHLHRVNKILGKPLYEKALFAARVYDVVQVTSKLLTHREKESRGMVWCSILTRWSIASHTIITTRGEFTFTLKNVNSTMLPYMIENSSVGTNIDSHSMETGEKLKPQISRSRFYALVVENLGFNDDEEYSTDEPSNNYDDDFLNDEMEYGIFVSKEKIQEKYSRSLIGIDSDDDFSDIDRN